MASKTMPGWWKALFAISGALLAFTGIKRLRVETPETEKENKP